MDRRETAAFAGEPDCPMRNREIRMPLRSEKHEIREGRGEKHEQTAL